MPVSTEIIQRAQQGNAAAAGEIYQTYQSAVYRYLFYSCADADSAEDLTGEVFLKMVEALPRFQLKSHGFQAWLFQIARNTAIDHARRLKTNRTIPLVEESADPGDAPGDVIEKALTSQMMKDAVQKLESDQRDVILMRFVTRMPLADVAATLHRSEDAVKGLQRRGLITLREILKKQEVIYEE
jgi:RNA polymerase sigma-70 factor (ECF subfamily)